MTFFGAQRSHAAEEQSSWTKETDDYRNGMDGMFPTSSLRNRGGKQKKPARSVKFDSKLNEILQDTKRLSIHDGCPPASSQSLSHAYTTVRWKFAPCYRHVGRGLGPNSMSIDFAHPLLAVTIRRQGWTNMHEKGSANPPNELFSHATRQVG